MPEQEADSQVDEPTSIQSLVIIPEFLFNYERWGANDEILLSNQLEELSWKRKEGLAFLRWRILFPLCDSASYPL